MGVTQKDIAIRVGIDRSVVAHALRGDPRVAESTRRRILEVAGELGYTANSNPEARSLISRRHGKKGSLGQIALLMGGGMDGLALQDMPFFREILQGIHAECAQHDLDVSIHVPPRNRLPRLVTSGAVNGVICVYSFDLSQTLRDECPELPAVRLGHSFEKGEAGIRPDDRQGGYLATRHLLGLGHRRIGFVGDLGIEPHEMRNYGYLDALRAAGVEADPDLLVSVGHVPSVTTGYRDTRGLFGDDRKFTALVCCNDAVALGVVKAATEAGLSVPGDLSVTGFDGARGEGYGGSESLSTVYFDRRIMGKRAVTLLNQLHDCESALDKAALASGRMLPVRMIEGRSTRPA